MDLSKLRAIRDEIKKASENQDASYNFQMGGIRLLVAVNELLDGGIKTIDGYGCPSCGKTFDKSFKDSGVCPHCGKGFEK